jgi:hypothetical protein
MSIRQFIQCRIVFHTHSFLSLTSRVIGSVGGLHALVMPFDWPARSRLVSRAAAGCVNCGQWLSSLHDNNLYATIFPPSDLTIAYYRAGISHSDCLDIVVEIAAAQIPSHGPSPPQGQRQGLRRTRATRVVACVGIYLQRMIFVSLRYFPGRCIESLPGFLSQFGGTYFEEQVRTECVNLQMTCAALARMATTTRSNENQERQ